MQQQRPSATSFSVAASFAPIKMWTNDVDEQSIYVHAKNTFLEFYTDETKTTKATACVRSASAESVMRRVTRSCYNMECPASPSKTRSTSPSTAAESESASCRDCGVSVATAISSEDQWLSSQWHPIQDVRVQDSPGPKMHPPHVLSIASALEPSDGVSGQADETDSKQDTTSYVTRNGKRVPKQDISHLGGAKAWGKATTLMVRGIPCSFTEERMMEIIDATGVAGKYDFFYLPRAGQSGSNLGYAFINFVKPSCANILKAALQGVALDPVRSTKCAAVVTADIQGIANLRKHFRRTAVCRGARPPLFFKVAGQEK